MFKEKLIMNYCDDYPFWWNYCPSCPPSSDTSELAKEIEAISGVLRTHIENDDIHVTSEEKASWNAKLDASAYTPTDLSEVYAQIEALNDKIEELEEIVSEISGDTPTPTPTPTPDTGETTTKKLIVTVLNKDNYELDCDSDSNLDTTLTKPNNDYLSYLTAEVGDCIREIDNSAFSGCFKMNRIVLPSTITVIHNHALSVDFYGEPVTHVDIYLYATVPPTLSQDGESGGYYFSQDFTLYVPSASVEAYKTAWPQYADNIEIMS